MAYDKQIQQILDEADDLPSLPGITQKVLQMTLSKDTSLKSISDVISTDAALVMRFLKIVNSAYYGFAAPINDISQAVAILGADAIRNVVVTLSLIDVFPIKINEEYSGLFKRSLCSAVASGFISEMESGKQSSDVFLAGMLQNLGMYILMLYLPTRYLKTIKDSRKHFVRLTFMEQIDYGIDHNAIGFIIGERWGLPESVLQAIKYKDKPAMFEKSSSFNADVLSLIKTTYLGGLTADIYFGWNKAWNIARLKKDMLLLMNYDEGTVNDLLAATPHLMQDVGFSDLAGIDQIPLYKTMLQEADNELVTCWGKSEENYSEFRRLEERVKVNENDILQYKKELDSSRQTLQKFAQKLNPD